MLRSLTAAVLAVPVALTLVACSSSSGKPKNSSSSGSSSASSGTPTGAATDGPSLQAKISTGLSGVTSAHLSLAETVAGQKLTGSADETLSNGTVTAEQATQTIPGTGQVELVSAGGKTYVKLPDPSNAAKPWYVLSTASKNSTVATIAGLIGPLEGATSLNTFGLLAGAASSVQAVGSQTVDGVATTHYKVVIDPTKLPASNPLKSSIGTKPLPVDGYLDAQGRPIQVGVTISLAGFSVPTIITVSDYNKALTITPPAADQIGG
jgi:hypothetical protein